MVHLIQSVCFTFAILLPTLAWVPLAPQRTRGSLPWTSSSSFKTTVSTLLYGANDNSVESRMGLNELHTMLRDAVQKEDYMEAGRISSVMMTRLYGDDPDVSEEELKARRRRMSWKGLGAAPWLTDRLDALNFTFPTTIQINAMEAVNAILNTTTEMVESTSLEQRVGNYDKDMGIVISGTTGSGKTLAYLVPLLSTLSDSLFARQRIRVGDEEKVGDTTGDLLDRVALVTSPVVRSNTKNPTKQGGPIATGASLATLGKSGKDVRSPLAVIVVPTRELGVQTSIELFELIGGSIKTNPTDFAGKANYFKYKGPKGIRISCVLDEAEVAYGLQLQTDIVITMPEFVGKLIETGDIIASKVRVVAFDEADLGLEQTKAEDLKLLFDDVAEEHELSRLTFLVGASVTKSLGDLAVRSHILPQGKSYIASATRFAPLGSDTDELMPDASRLGEESKTASLKDLDLCLHPGLVHERAIVKNNTGLIVLTRLLRKELQKYENVATQVSGPKATQPPRVVVFFPDEAQAKAAIAPLRDAMWGEHKLCVLLPKIGVSPLDIMEDFKNNETTVMLATPNSVRGLDFPALTHVYTLYLPMDDPREYVHLAGRVGRVGQSGNVLGDGAHVVSILKEDEANKMNDLAKTLGFEFTDIEATPDVFAFSDGDLDDDDDDDDDDSIESKVRVETAMDKSTLDKMRRNLEDSISMGDLWDDETKSSIPNDFIDAVNEYDDYDGDGEPEDEEEGAFQ